MKQLKKHTPHFLKIYPQPFKTWFLKNLRLCPNFSTNWARNQVFFTISQRIELESMLRCLNERINEPDIFSLAKFSLRYFDTIVAVRLILHFESEIRLWPTYSRKFVDKQGTCRKFFSPLALMELR